MMAYCSKFDPWLLLLWFHWVFDLFLSIFQLIEIISHLTKYQLNYPMIPLTCVFLRISIVQITSTCNYFSGLSSELPRFEIFFTYLQIIKKLKLSPHRLNLSQCHHEPQSKISPPNLTSGPCPRPPRYSLSVTSAKSSSEWVSNRTSLHFHYHCLSLSFL